MTFGKRPPHGGISKAKRFGGSARTIPGDYRESFIFLIPGNFNMREKVLGH
jgi:hypothetical protein